MKILQVVKTTEGAWWALEQVKCLVANKEFDIHVTLPDDKGKFVQMWKETGATIHIENLDFPTTKPLELYKRINKAKKLLNKIKPDLIHSHFFGNTIILRKANSFNIPLVFQVPGPLHLEKRLFKNWELLSSSKNDYWIASSKYIKDLYLKNNIGNDRVFLSYYGSNYENFNSHKNYSLREKYHFSKENFVIGNVSYIYPPKRYLFQKTGLKNHELIIESIAKANTEDSNIKGLLFGGQWGNQTNYEDKLKNYASSLCGKNISLTGKIHPSLASKAWQNLNLAIHLPKSENCGGVIEPLLSNLPVLTNNTGGIPEVIFDNVTGFISHNNSDEISKKVLEIYKNYKNIDFIVKNGQNLVSTMFDVKRTSQEISQIYKHILNGSYRPIEFNSKDYIKELK